MIFFLSQASYINCVGGLLVFFFIDWIEHNIRSYVVCGKFHLISLIYIPVLSC
jgi:hypothetical protein